MVFVKQYLVILLLALLVKENQSWRRRRRRRRAPPPTPPPCPVQDCQVSNWSEWSTCSHRCGNSGTQSRTRSKTVSKSCGGSCSYHFREARGCNRNACQNGGTPTSGLCYCRVGFKGTCCEFVDKGPKIYFNYVSPLHPTVYKVIKGSLTGVQKAFDDPKHDTIAKNDHFTVIVDVSSQKYNPKRQWHEIQAVFCFGENIKECMDKKRPFGDPYLVNEHNLEIPVPFMVPFKTLIPKNVLPAGRDIYVAGTVSDQFNTFEVNGARYDTSTGLLASFSAKSSIQAGQISGIEFTRNKGKALIKQPMIQCHFVEWTTDGCVPGLNNMMLAYDIKLMQINSRRWLKPVDFPRKKDERYLQTLDITGNKQKTYLVFKDMTLGTVLPMANPFSYLFKSVEEQVETKLKSVGMSVKKKAFLGSGKYGTYSKYYSKRSYAAAMSGVEYHFFRATMSSSYFQDENNWDDIFKNKWKNMFTQSKKENAMDFFREYGTHFVFEAWMGGRQETLFTVDYCEINKEKGQMIALYENLEKPYKFVPNSVSIKAYFKYMVKHSLSSKIFISGPETTCIGGNSFDSDVCYNITLWRETVSTNPWPIKMTLKPFHTLVKDYRDRQWMENMYQAYLTTDLDEERINHYKLLQQVKCSKSKLRSHDFLVLWCIFSLVVVA